MPCPTCSHTMQEVAIRGSLAFWWCPRCGTLRSTGGGNIRDERPMLVERLRAYSPTLTQQGHGEWHRLGITKAIYPEGERLRID